MRKTRPTGIATQTHRPGWPIELIFVAGFLLHLALFYPGFMCYDAVNQILEARANVYSDWHPPLMARIWRWSDSFLPGPAGMLILQLSSVWLGTYWIFGAFFKPQGLNVAAPLLCGILFYPPVFGISGAILKDMLMWGVLLMAFGLSGYIQSYRQAQNARSFALFGAILLLLALAMSFRHNAFFATIPLLSHAWFRLASKASPSGLLKAALAGCLIATGLFLATGTLNDKLADRHTHPWVASAAFDIAGIIKRLDDKPRQQALFDRLASALNSTGGSVEPLLKAYTPLYWREIFRARPPTLELPKNSMEQEIHGFESLSPAQLSALHELWRETLLQEPRLWLRHRSAVSKYILGLVPEANWSPIIMGQDFPADLEQAYGTHPVPTAVQVAIESALLPWLDAWFFQPWPYFIGVMGLCLVVFLRGIQSNLEVFCLTSSAILHELGLMIAAPSPDFRYSHYMIFCCLLGALLWLRPWLQRRSHSKGVVLE